MRLIKCLKKHQTEYLTEGMIYEVQSLNGGTYNQIYFQRAGGPYPCGSYLKEQRVKEMIQKGMLIFVD